MVELRVRPHPGDIRQSARHTLFVESDTESGFDVKVLDELLEGRIDVKPLGPSFNIAAAAEALFRHHPNYYFLIDRDHQDDETVERSWKNFPDAETKNLLIWRRRQFENYFLIPEYLEKSECVACSREDLERHILKFASERVFLDIANLVIIQIRERMKKNWIQLFENIRGFETREKALEALLNRKEFGSKKRDVSKSLREEAIEKSFEDTCHQFFGEADDLQFGYGRWLEMISGKDVLRQIADKCFRIKDNSGKWLQGDERILEVGKDLVRKDLLDQPADFQDLYRMIHARIQAKRSIR